MTESSTNKDWRWLHDCKGCTSILENSFHLKNKVWMFSWLKGDKSTVDSLFLSKLRNSKLVHRCKGFKSTSVKWLSYIDNFWSWVWLIGVRSIFSNRLLSNTIIFRFLHVFKGLKSTLCSWLFRSHSSCKLMQLLKGDKSISTKGLLSMINSWRI